MCHCVSSLCLCMENDERTAICVESSLPEKISSLFIIFSDYFPQKCQAKNHDGSGQKFLSTSDSIWPQFMAALVIIMVCKLGGTSSISVEKFVNPWTEISFMSEPIITRGTGPVQLVYKAPFSFTLRIRILAVDYKIEKTKNVWASLPLHVKNS